MEFALFSAVALGALGFLLRVAGQSFGAIMVTSEGFRVCQHQAGQDNDNQEPYEVRSVAGWLQMARPSVSMNSWAVGTNEVSRGCFAEWGTHLTMSNSGGGQGFCQEGPGEPRVIAYSGPNAIVNKRSEYPCGGIGGNWLISQTTVSAGSSENVNQSSGGLVTTGSVTAGGGGTLVGTTMAGAVSHSVGYGGTFSGQTSDWRTNY